MYNVSFKEVTESELPYFFGKSNLTIANRPEMSKKLLPQSEKNGCEEYTEKIAPAYDTKTWAGNILSFTGSAVICGVPFRIKESRKV